MSIDQTQRTRQLLQKLTRSSSVQVQMWDAVEGCVVISLSREASRTKNGQLAFFTVINLLARLHPVVTAIAVYLEADAPVLLYAPLFDGRTVSEAVQNFVTLLQSPVTVTLDSSRMPTENAEVTLNAGGFQPGTSQISFGSDGWNVSLDSDSACGFSDIFNPVGSMSVACLAASEAFKRVFTIKASRIGVPPDSVPPMLLLNGRSSISTFTYRPSDSGAPNPELPLVLDIGKLSVVGVGAGGGACLYALATLSLYGELWTIDPDVVNSHNLNRHIYATEKDGRELKKKVDVTSRLFSSQQTLQRFSFDIPFMDFKSRYPDWPRDLVMSTVDTVETRHAIQWEIPRIILDAAVNQSVFYVHRVELGRSACLKCTHNASGEQPDIIRAIAAALGLEQAEVARLYFDNILLTGEAARNIGHKVGSHGLPPLTEGMKFRDWVMLHCGQLRLTVDSEMVLPIPFAVVLPGILLAGEIIKERYFPENVVRHRINHDVFGHPSDWLTTPLYPKDGCPLCSDEMVRRAYKSLYWHT